MQQQRPPKIIVLDMDSSESPTYGEQEGSAYNGHFGCTCYHPLFVFNQFGDVERCTLRPGNVHSADGWRAVLEPVIARYRGIVKHLYFRGDAAFANPEIYEFLEAESAGYTIRLPANHVLQDKIGHLLKRPVGRPPREVRRYYASFRYQAQSWNKSRHVVAKVEWHPDDLYPRVGFIVTNLARSAEGIVAFYNQRGTCEQYIKEGKNAVKWTRLSCRTFAANAVRLQLHALAYNLGNFMRTLAMPKTADPWSLTSLREKLVKIGAKVVSAAENKLTAPTADGVNTNVLKGGTKMSSRLVIGTAMLASMGIGALAVEGLHAQSKPPVYFIGEIEVTNPEGYAKEYLPKAREIIKSHGGQLVASGGAAGASPIIAVDGEPPKRVVIYRYPNADAVQAWRNDPAYQDVRKIGEKYAKYRTFAVEGAPQQ